MDARISNLKAREQASICRTYGRYPLEIASAKDCRLFDFEGKAYVDLLAGVAVVNCGHSREDLAQVAYEQMLRLVHTSNLCYTLEQVNLAEALTRLSGLGKAFFCNSGAEANEAAVKLARRYMRTVKSRDAYEIITLEGSFHGRTLGMITATGQAKVKEYYAPLPEGFTTVAWDDLAAMEAAISERTAAVLVEVVQGEGGVRPATREYLQGVQALCRKHDVLFMVDEIQTGLGRTGRFFAFQHHDLSPDIVTMAKGMANGLPLGAMLASDEVAAGFAPGSHATTFGGGPVVTAVALKVLEILERERLVERSAKLGERFKARFLEIRDKYPNKVVQVRGLGLMLGIELASSAGPIWTKLLEAGFLCNVTQDRVLRLLPPLTISEADLEAFAKALEEILADA
ncbi:acetylornithine/succinylornithine family transaminase [Megalodesulfovibrio paquesii]